MTRREEIAKASICQYQIIGTIGEQEAFKNGFVEGAEWAEKTMIEKACKWVEKHIFDFPWYDNEQGDFSSKDIANALCKAMEE